MSLPKERITEVVRYCNRDLVPDQDFSQMINIIMNGSYHISHFFMIHK